jgi:hypothetical protein
MLGFMNSTACTLSTVQGQVQRALGEHTELLTKLEVKCCGQFARCVMTLRAKSTRRLNLTVSLRLIHVLSMLPLSTRHAAETMLATGLPI